MDATTTSMNGNYQAVERVTEDKKASFQKKTSFPQKPSLPITFLTNSLSTVVEFRK